jgi:hypothetical protein
MFADAGPRWRAATIHLNVTHAPPSRSRS